MSPLNGSCSIESSAARTRRRSAAGIRLSAFVAGPARSSSHFIAEFVQGYEIASSERGSTAPNRAQFVGRWSLLRNPIREVGAQRLPHEFGPSAVLVRPHALQLLEHRGRQRNGEGGSGTGHKTTYDLIIPGSTSLSSTR